MNLKDTVNKNYNHLYKVCLQACSYNKDLAYELLHETIFLIYEYYDMDKIEAKYKTESDKVNYLVRCCKTQRYSKTSYFYYKYIKIPYTQEIENDEYAEEIPDDVEYEIRVEEMKDKVDKVIRQMTFYDRFLFTQFYENDMNINKIGQFLAVPRGKIYKDVYSMQDKLKKLLKQLEK